MFAWQNALLACRALPESKGRGGLEPQPTGANQQAKPDRAVHVRHARVGEGAGRFPQSCIGERHDDDGWDHPERQQCNGDDQGRQPSRRRQDIGQTHRRERRGAGNPADRRQRGRPQQPEQRRVRTDADRNDSERDQAEVIPPYQDPGPIPTAA